MLELDAVDASYGRVPAIRSVTLAVAADEIVTLIGSNGAGKSTTLRTISGLLPIQRGEIRFLGESIGGRRAHEIVRRGIVHVPEGRRIFHEMTVRENLMLGGYGTPNREVPGEIDRIYGIFPHLAERSGQLAGQLSGGEQQMLAIGRGLMARPKLLMLDEPSLGLAPKLVELVAEMIGSIRAMGISVLLVEQNARLALAIADRAYVLQTGSVILSGPSAVLRDDPMVQKAYLGL
jgi:branched-chain amino acid transport system ATP-binding protein